MGHQHDLQARLRRTVIAMLTVAVLVGTWSATTSGYAAPTASTAETVAPANGRGARAGALLAYAQTRLAMAATTTTTTEATVPVTETEPASSLAGTLTAAPSTTAPTTTTTHTHATTTTTTHTHATTTTTTAPTTTTTAISIPPSPGRLSEEEAIALFSKYFEPEDVDTALRVAKCESNLDPSAWNPNGHGGLFQHAISAWDARAEAAGWAGADIFDAEANTAVSAWLVYKDGWWHWTCY